MKYFFFKKNYLQRKKKKKIGNSFTLYMNTKIIITKL